jgi:O-antigen ligase
MGLWVLTALWTAMGLLLWAIFPMTSTVLLPLCCVAPLAWYRAACGRLTWYPVSLVTAALIVVAAYLLVNASWSLSLATAARTVAFAFVMVGALHVVINTLPNVEEAPLRAMAVGALAGLGAGAALLCLEVFSDQSLRRHIMHLIPALQPGPQHMEMAAGQPERLAPYLTNASISVLAVMFWPAALLATRLALSRALRYAALVAAAVLVATVLASDHATSQVALVGASLAFLLFRVRPKLAMPLVVSGWLAAGLLVVPVATLLFNVEAYRASWLPESARHRIVIWRHTSDLIPKAPLLGAGIGTARAINEAEAGEAPLVPGTRFHLATNLHSHNAYLQVWYEAGAMGALLMLGLGLVTLRSLTQFPTDVQPYLVATFAGCALMVASAYSIWAPWFMASLAMAAVFAALGAALPPPAALRRLPAA